MAHSLSGTLFSGGPTLGRGVGDDDWNIFGADGDKTAPATQADKNAFCTSTGGTVGADGLCYYGKAPPGKPSCSAGQYWDPVSGKCEKNPELGPGGVSPWVNPCPVGQTTYNGKCVKVGVCPSGQTWGLDTQKCESSYVYKPPKPGGSGGPVTPKQTTPAQQSAPPEEESWLTPAAIAVGLFVVAGVGVVYYRRKKRGR